MSSQAAQPTGCGAQQLLTPRYSRVAPIADPGDIGHHYADLLADGRVISWTEPPFGETRRSTAEMTTPTTAAARRRAPLLVRCADPW